MNQNNHNIYGYKAIIYMPFFLVPNSHTHIKLFIGQVVGTYSSYSWDEILNYSTCIVKVDFFKNILK